ncbi:DUF6392 family protein [Klebsiella pneumoniae]|nr:DUF6392 family protein [Klebsiella pneumoniae]
MKSFSIVINDDCQRKRVVLIKNLKEEMLRFGRCSLQTDWLFPNPMPFGLERVMIHQWVRAYLGFPMVYVEAKNCYRLIIGGEEIYTLPIPHQKCSVGFNYNNDLFSETVTFYPLKREKEISYCA